MKQSENPFIVGQPVQGNDFFGRKEILEDINNFLSDSDKNIFFISGQRRSGKTSLLKKIQELNCQNNKKFIYLNLQDKADLDISELSKKIILRLNNSLKISNVNDLNFIEFLSKVNENKENELVILLDEFDVMCKPNENESNNLSKNEFLEFLLSSSEFIKDNKIKVNFIIAAGLNYSTSVKELCYKLNKNTIFYRLDNFNPDTTKTILKTSKSISFTKKAVSQVNKYTGGNPYFVQALSHSLYENAMKCNRNKIKKKHVKNNLEDAVKSFAFGLNSIWNDLSENDKILLFLSAHLLEKKQKICPSEIFALSKVYNINIALTYIEYGLEYLKKNNFLIISDSEKYVFNNEFFRKWIVSEVDMREVNKLIK